MNLTGGSTFTTSAQRAALDQDQEQHNTQMSASRPSTPSSSVFVATEVLHACIAQDQKATIFFFCIGRYLDVRVHRDAADN